MSMSPPRGSLPSERIQVELEHDRAELRVRIWVEGYDEQRGWCPIGSISFPQHQLPLLEQALADMKSGPRHDATATAKIIPFPGPGPARGHGRDQARL